MAMSWFNVYMSKNHLLVVLGLPLVFASLLCRQASALVHNDIDHCPVSRCSSIYSPIIRFPFHLKHDKHDDSCTFPGFQLSCDYYPDYPVIEFEYQVNTSQPGLYLSFSLQARITSIEYKLRQLSFFSSYLPNITVLSSSHSAATAIQPFTLIDTAPHPHSLTFYKCPSKTNGPDYYCYYYDYNIYVRKIDSLSDHGFVVYAASSDYTTHIYPLLLTSCTKLYNISGVPFFYYDGTLSWSAPDCDDCEAKGEYCKLKVNSTTNTHCFPIPKGSSSRKHRLAGKVGAIIFLPLLVLALCYAIYWYKQNKNYQVKLETFLEDYKALKPTRYSYADIKKITNHFKFKLGQGGYGSVFKGQLSSDVVVAVKVLNETLDSKGSGEDFINEVSTIGLIHHVNVVRLVGYCADGFKRALVYEFLPNNSLDKFVYSGKKHSNGFLGWEKMQEIALGIAKGIDYLHQGCAQRILHFDIKPHNILLDQNFDPKISDFGLAKLCTKGQSIVSMTMARGTIGYIAPEVYSRNFGKVSSKSDVYSFGMLLLEMVGAKDNTSAGAKNNSEVYFPEWIFNELEQGREVRSEIEEEVDSKIAKKLTIVGLWCVNWHPADRPSMKHVIKMIQAEDCPPIPPNPFSSTRSTNTSTLLHARPFVNELEVISESE